MYKHFKKYIKFQSISKKLSQTKYLEQFLIQKLKVVMLMLFSSFSVINKVIVTKIPTAKMLA